MNSPKTLAHPLLLVAVLDAVLTGRYLVDATGIQCEPCREHLPCPPCRTDFMQLFPELMLLINATLLLTLILQRRLAAFLARNTP